MSTQPTPQPDQVTASVEGTQAPVAAAPAPLRTNGGLVVGTGNPIAPPQTSGGMFDKVLGALAGNPKTYSVDPNTGTETGQPVTDRGSLAKHIVAAALVGLLKGAGARGPNSLGVAAAQGGQAGFALGQQEEQQAKQEPLGNYHRNQEAATAKANALEKNLRLRSMAQTLSDADENTHKQIVTNSADLLDRVKTESPSSVLAEGIPEGEAKDPAKYNILDQRIPDGVVPRLGADGQQEKDADGVPQWEQTYTILDRHTKSSIAGAPWVQQAVEWGIPGAKGLSALGPNDQLTAVGQNHYIYQLGQLQAMQGELDSFAKKVGASPVDLKAMVNKDPSLIEAVNQFQRTSGASTQPDLQLDAMRQDPKAAPYVNRVMGMFGADNLEKFKENRVNKLAADKSAAEATAKAGVEASTPEGQQKIRLNNLNEQEKALDIEKKKQDLTAAKAGALVEGTDATGNQVAGTPQELQQAGVTNFVKMPALTQTQTLAARELTSPDGLFAQARNQILALNKAGKLGAVSSRWNNFWASKGLDGDQQAFRGTLGLIATKLMQAHMGNRGGKDALEHFAGLVPENSTPAALMTELNNEYQYVNSLSKRPKVANVQ